MAVVAADRLLVCGNKTNVHNLLIGTFHWQQKNLCMV